MKTEQKGLENGQRKTWEVIPFENSDLPELGLFFKKYFAGRGVYGSMGIFQWRTVDNFVMQGIINLIKDGNRIVSTLSNTPKHLFVGGQECLVAEIGDANTDPSYQRQGMLTLLIKQSTQDALDRGIQGVYSTPSSHTPSLPAFIKKGNYFPHPGMNIKSLVLPLDVGPFIQRRSHWLLGHYIGSLFLTVVYIYYLLMKGLNRSQSLEIVERHSLPDEWNSFWEKSRTPYDFIFSRNKEALTWRFFRNPNKYTFYTLAEKDEIVGYVVYRIVADAEIKMLTIADFFFVPGCESYFKVILLKILADALRTGVNYINTWCIKGSPYYSVFERYCFIPRDDILLIWFQNKFSFTLQKNCSTWHFTVSDSDNI